MSAADLNWMLASLAWSLAGLFLGYALGRMSREVHELREALVDEQDAHDDARGVERRSGYDRREPPPGGRMNALLGAALIVLAALSVSASAVAVSRQQAQVDCQARYNRAMSDALNARGQAIAQDRAAIVALVRDQASLMAQAGTLPREQVRARVRESLERFVTASEQAQAQREANPLPPPPGDLCG